MWAALPPLLAIWRCLSESIEANPRLGLSFMTMPSMIWLFFHSRQTRCLFERPCAGVCRVKCPKRLHEKHTSACTCSEEMQRCFDCTLSVKRVRPVRRITARFGFVIYAAVVYFVRAMRNGTNRDTREECGHSARKMLGL